MEISRTQLDKFKELCRTRMGIELDDTRARKEALNLLQLLVITRKPLPSKPEREPP